VPTTEAGSIQPEPKEAAGVIHQCKHCLTVYVPALGDEDQGILPETPFNELPATYACPLCEAPKEAFAEIVERGEKSYSTSGLL
jgi:rubredoxin